MMELVLIANKKIRKPKEVPFVPLALMLKGVSSYRRPDTVFFYLVI